MVPSPISTPVTSEGMRGICYHDFFDGQLTYLPGKSWKVFHDRLFLGRCFGGFDYCSTDYCSAVWCSAADAHLKLLDHAVSGACFLTGGEFECDLAHRLSVAVLCMLRKFECCGALSEGQQDPLRGALPEPYVTVRVTHGAVKVYRLKEVDATRIPTQTEFSFKGL